MTSVMAGVRVVEVAELTFVPAAAALMSDWGAEVVKVEPIERGDAVRGMTGWGPAKVNVLHEHSNRGKRSIALDLAHPEGIGILYKLVAESQVFMTNKVSRVRRKLKMDVEDLRAHNPDLIYVRGTGWGERGSQADRGGYDLLSFWHRSGASVGTASPDGELPYLPGPAFGDSIGALTVAAGVMGALFHRERTGDAPVVDVSLLGTGFWAMGASIAAAGLEESWTWPPAKANPLSASYQTADGLWLALCCLQAGRYWPAVCQLVGRPDLAIDDRFRDHESIISNCRVAKDLLAGEFAKRDMQEWQERLRDFPGHWTSVQDARRAGSDEQAVANGYIQDCITRAGDPFSLIAAPVQYDGEAARPSAAPEFNEHGDLILAELGFSAKSIIDLKFRGVVG